MNYLYAPGLLVIEQLVNHATCNNKTNHEPAINIWLALLGQLMILCMQGIITWFYHM